MHGPPKLVESIQIFLSCISPQCVEEKHGRRMPCGLLDDVTHRLKLTAIASA